MKVLKYILLILIGLAALFFLTALFARHDYHIERSIEIEAPRQIVYDQVRFFKNAPNWSPWLYLDPNVKTSIEGTDGAPGAVYKWSGNKDIGTGSQTIKSVTPERIDLTVVFNDFSGAPAYFAFSGKGDTTKVIWSMDMHVPFPWNALSMLTDMNNSFIGKDFENGLSNLKKYCEALAPKKYRGYKVLAAARPDTYYAYLRQVVDFQNLSSYLSERFPTLKEAAEKSGAKMTGFRSGFFWNYDTLTLKSDMAAAIALDKQIKAVDSIQIIRLGGQALQVEHLGDYAKAQEAYNALDDYVLEKKLQKIPPAIEEYVVDASQEPDTAKWVLRIIYLVEPKRDSTQLKEK